MTDPKKILVAIDDFRQSEHLINYLAALARESSDFYLHLFHAAGPLPPNLLESPGAEDPTEEIRVEQKQERAQERWVSKAKAETQRQFDAHKAQLVVSKFPKANIFTHFIVLNQRDDFIPEIIKAAHQNNCGTIIVGHESYGWIREQFHTHVSEQLIAELPGVAVCVVSK
jgi:nucleotide-binding universal stress UspA family protein